MKGSYMTLEEEAQLQARALVVQRAGGEIAAILLERLSAHGEAAGAPPGEMIATLLAAAFHASQTTQWPYSPADYVALVRVHADTVERLHCQ
jgi:hypothetical protein